MTANTKPNVDLGGQVALVTGGGRGLGRAFAIALADAGAQVALIGRTAAPLDETQAQIEASGGRAMAFPADVSERQQIEQVVGEIETSLGPVDLLVNNAAVAMPVGPLWQIEPEAWWHVLEVNLYGVLVCSHAVLPGMVARRRGRIIHLASAAGLAGIPYFSPYVVSKTAVIRLAENMAQETSEHGVSVFAISPGTVRTAMSEEALGAEARQWLPWFGKIFAEGRDVPPERAVDLVLRLASGSYDPLTGRYLSIHDDLDQLLERLEDVRRKSLHTLRLSRLD